MSKELNKLGKALGLLCIFLLMFLFEAFVILRISLMYGLEFISELGYIKILGILFIFSIINLKIKSKEKIEGETDDNLDGAWKILKNRFFAIMLLYFTAYLYFHMLS